ARRNRESCFQGPRAPPFLSPASHEKASPACRKAAVRCRVLAVPGHHGTVGTYAKVTASPDVGLDGGAASLRHPQSSGKNTPFESCRRLVPRRCNTAAEDRSGRPP